MRGRWLAALLGAWTVLPAPAIPLLGSLLGEITQEADLRTRVLVLRCHHQ